MKKKHITFFLGSGLLVLLLVKFIEYEGVNHSFITSDFVFYLIVILALAVILSKLIDLERILRRNQKLAKHIQKELDIVKKSSDKKLQNLNKNLADNEDLLLKESSKTRYDLYQVYKRLKKSMLLMFNSEI